jgi:hypothetical protein
VHGREPGAAIAVTRLQVSQRSAIQRWVGEINSRGDFEDPELDLKA